MSRLPVLRCEGAAPRRHYGYAVIAMALAPWLVVGKPVREVGRASGDGGDELVAGTAAVALGVS